MKRVSRDEITALFSHEQKSILRLTSGCSGETGAKQVLIDRMPAIEDSSRFWSVYMVLDHLCIVNSRILMAMRLLSKGKVPQKETSTADLKPSAETGLEIIEKFKVDGDKFIEMVSEIQELDNKLKYAHPWFGPLNLKEWYFLTAFHMGLHRRQIEKILEAD